ncbi:phage tail sheath family protein [Nostoc sp. UIC 10607]|uniref:phage tail sheath family protein n=1 Tax=Nostoc sp. UIC 10607 TaxID=3045935 RepID=UPI0039A20A95
MPGPYLAPGVYVEEVPPLARPIAGVGTSTAGFIGVIPDNFIISLESVSKKTIDVGDGSKTSFNLPQSDYPVDTTTGKFTIRVNGNLVTDATLTNDDANRISKVDLTSAPGAGQKIEGDYIITRKIVVGAGEPKLCTSFDDYKKYFGDFSATDSKQNTLTHAVYGFFNNGGSRCYVVRAKQDSDIRDDFLARSFEPIDEIAIVAAPGLIDSGIRSALVTHCAVKTKDRIAVLDCPELIENTGQLDLTKLNPLSANNILPDKSDYAAFYFPWIQVFDSATKAQNPTGDGLKYVPPGGHIAGIYARVDKERGVFKAPANEPIYGALGLKYNISQAQQEGLNPQGVNVIRSLNGNIRVWGARTIRGDANGEYKYISTRRLYNFLRESIDQGTQFAVFEPNSPALWQRITRNVSDFLLGQWRDGALFGDTPKQAFFVRCNAETNPSDVRERGEVVTEIGVAIVKPAEFVVFRIQQITGG